jgi:hypothetical protein
MSEGIIVHLDVCREIVHIAAETVIVNVSYMRRLVYSLQLVLIVSV